MNEGQWLFSSATFFLAIK